MQTRKSRLMKIYFKLEEHVFFNLQHGSIAQVLNCHFQALPRAMQNISYFNLLNLLEKS